MLTNLMVLVPMPRLWGMVGWWWYVPATVAYPFLVPMLVTMGMTSLVPRDTVTQSQEVEGHNRQSESRILDNNKQGREGGVLQHDGNGREGGRDEDILRGE
jgi:hypothetical protein